MTPPPRDTLASTGKTPASAPDAQASPEALPPEGGAPQVTKKDLFVRVKARADGVQGRDLRLVMDALLEELGAAIAAGETLKLPGLGTLTVHRRKDLGNADLAVCKLRRKKPAPKSKDPLAIPSEAG